MSRYGIKTLASLILLSLLCGCAVKKTRPTTPLAQPPVPGRNWTEVSTPFPAANITAIGDIFWVCGADEMIASSSDGGSTWKLSHQKRDGAVLLHIAFVNEKVGHAAGRPGLLLSTTDGGKTWNAHNVGDDVLAFSFSDAENGIAVMGPEADVNRFAQPGWGSFTTVMDGAVRMTHDGGEHWEEIPALSSEELRPFKTVLAVAALDSSHCLMLRRQPMIEDAFLVTDDAGASWQLVHQRNDATNRELAERIFVHDGEYWAFGMEFLNRQQGGGYGAPLTVHSKDGKAWAHGTGGPKEFGGCNSQGCYMCDGAVETLYGEREQYWALPQDGSLSDKWAIAGNRACTIDTTIECGPAIMVEKPPQTPRDLTRSVGQPHKITNHPFEDDCVLCGVKTIRLDPGRNWEGHVVVSFAIDQNGAVTDLAEEGALEGPLGALIEDQVQRWRFKVPAGATSTTTQQRHVPIDVKCIDAPDVPTMDGCQMFPWKTPL